MLLEISTAIGCPVGCGYCPQATIARTYAGPRLMPLATFRAALSNAPEKAPMSFAGFAEPYVNPATSAMIEEAVGLGHPVQVYTTGHGMTDSDVDTLIRIQPYNLVLHMPDNDGDMKVDVTPEYVASVERMMASVKASRAVCYGSPHPRLKAVWPKLLSLGLQSRAGNVAHLPKAATKRGPVRCKPARSLDNVVMLPSGDIAVCCQDYALRHVLGNLARQTWNKIRSGPAMAALLVAMAQDGDCLCRSCEYSEAAP